MYSSGSVNPALSVPWSFVTYVNHVLASQNTMRRIVASLALVLMAWSFSAPMALGLAGTAAAACCRRNGKHHCASEMSGMAALSADDLPSFRANSPDCPYRSQIATPTGVAHPQSPAVITLQTPSASVVAAVDCLFLDYASPPVMRSAAHLSFFSSQL